ncbi:MAG: hypothetical protein LR015_02730 [Verrucomicrobia bacterium]|nr:hypothetical protein [Verrucomicrobiota bacterium]
MRGVRVAEDTILAPVVSSLRINASHSADGLEFTRFIAEEGARPAAHLTLTAPGARDPYGNVILVRGEAVIERGSRIATDAGGSIVITGNAVSVQGHLEAPGGSIRVAGGSEYATNNPSPVSAQITTVIGPEAVLNATGKGVLLSDPRGLLTGTIWDGGSIFVGGNAILQRGATLEATGTSGVLDVAATAVQSALEQPGSLAGKLFVPVEIHSAGGTIHLSGSDLLASHANLQVAGGNGNAPGGTVIVDSGRFYADNQTSTTADITLMVSEQTNLFAGDNSMLATGALLNNVNGQSISGGGRISNDALISSGADHLQLLGNVHVDGNVRLTTTGSIRIASGGVLRVDDSLEIQTGYLFAGQNFRAPEDPNQRLPYFTQTIPGLGLREFYFTPGQGSGQVQLSREFCGSGDTFPGRSQFDIPFVSLKYQGFRSIQCTWRRHFIRKISLSHQRQQFRYSRLQQHNCWDHAERHTSNRCGARVWLNPAERRRSLVSFCCRNCPEWQSIGTIRCDSSRVGWFRIRSDRQDYK